jgi:peptidoglycan/xylan/chitin deacetylase (PgdA/CDA1 family)
LLYHSVEKSPSDYPYSVSVESFKAHIDILSNYFEIVSLDKLVYSSTQKPRVALTFDDAYDDFYTTAFPVLQERQLNATVFVPTKFIDTNLYVYTSEVEKYQKYQLTWDQMRELQSSGLVEFGSHTHSHIDAVENIDILKDDILTSIRTIEKELDRPPRYFAYPYGDCTSATHKIVLSCGFEKIFTTQNIPVTDGDVQGRHNIWRPNENNGRFMLTIAGIKS